MGFLGQQHPHPRAWSRHIDRKDTGLESEGNPCLALEEAPTPADVHRQASISHSRQYPEAHGCGITLLNDPERSGGSIANDGTTPDCCGAQALKSRAAG